MVFDRPQKPGQSQPKPSPATNRPNPAIQKSSSQTPKTKKIITVGGGGSSGGGRSKGGDDGGGKNPPSPWLNPDNEPNPATTASFVEYLRWMRSPDHEYKDPTKVQILQMTEERANYRDRLTQLTQRTELIAGKENTFQVKCAWRIRVGGHRGLESILLPAFDALGMPYIPSSTLRGVARSQAIQEIIGKEKISWKEAEKKVAPYFGSLEAKNRADRAGKVIFLDAYPLPNSGCGLTVDMANNIWKWENGSLKYDPNPNPFLSLKQPSFLIGLRLASGCNDSTILKKVQQWLIKGLQSGIGSQVNTGYGELMKAGEGRLSDEFFRIDFSLQGQLIHGRQKFTEWKCNNDKNTWQTRGQAEAEVRPIAFKSMLRYWFRTLALGVLELSQVKEWEAKLFGAIQPKQRGWVRFDVLEGKVTRNEPQPNRMGQNDDYGEQEGILTLAYSLEAPEGQKEAIAKLFQNLTWLMFHLGGVGQGARRPCYSRQDRSAAPWWRGSTLIPDSDESFWKLPVTPKEFQTLFQNRLQGFYKALGDLGVSVNYRSPKTVVQPTSHSWFEAVDSHCKIIVVRGESDTNKPYSLDLLHQQFHQLENQQYTEAKSLCGGVKNDRPKINGSEITRKVTPSPMWISDLDKYQVVTVFGATEDPRKKYLKELRDRTSPQNYIQLWPFT